MLFEKMKIIVFLKTVKYIYAQTGTDPKKNFIGPDDIIHIINPFDEFAVEEALGIKEKYEGTEIIVVSLGDRFAEEGLRRTLAMGTDRAIHFHYEEYEKLDAWGTAMILASLIRNLQFQLIFCGREAVDDHAGLVGPYIAEILRIPHITRVVKVELDQDRERLLLQRDVGRGNRELMESTFPALVTVERSMNTPRYPTLPGILKAQSQGIERFRIEDLRLPKEIWDPTSHWTETINLSLPKPKTRARSTEEGKLSASDRIRLLTEGGKSKQMKASNILEGHSDKVLDELERILKEHGIILE